jgi:S-(hydroxymethyl)glutathione dehydrogenase / alcohol dehydrogenase
MKAAVLDKVGGKYEIRDVELDAPKGREVLVDVKASGLCHSDEHIRSHDFGFPMPTVLGHEIAGIVREIGPDVTSLAVGDHVAGSLVSFCGNCDQCMQGAPFRCLNQNTSTARGVDETQRITAGDGTPITQFMGLAGFAEQALSHENNLVKINKEIPFDRACLLGCGVVTGIGTAINTAGVRPGDYVAVFGCGGVGLNGVQGARIAGARRIIAIDLQPEKLELAKKFGATDTINPKDEDVVERVLEITGGYGVHHAFEMIGVLATMKQAFEILGMDGTAYVVGMQQPDSTLDLTLFGDVLMKRKSVKGVFMGSTNPQIDIPMYADLYVQGRLNLDDLVSKRIGLDEINEAYQELEGGKVARAVITFD